MAFSIASICPYRIGKNDTAGKNFSPRRAHCRTRALTSVRVIVMTIRSSDISSGIKRRGMIEMLQFYHVKITQNII